MFPLFSSAQNVSVEIAASAASSSLPEAPQIAAETPSALAPRQRSILEKSGERPQSAEAYRFAKYVEAGQTAAKLSPFDKFLLGTRHSTSSFAVATWVFSASYEQALDQRPNYGQTGKGYLQRLGAAAAHNTSSGMFSDSVLAPILREDPRYYKLGRGHGIGQRILYAVTRPVIGRTDGGSRTINFAQIGGNLASAGLTDAYYPSKNRTAGETLATFGTSMGGGAFGYLFNEFFSIRLPWER